MISIVAMVIAILILFATAIVLLTRTVKKSRVIADIEKALKEKKFEEAEKLVQSTNSNSLDPFMSRYFLAQAYEGQNKLDLAITFYEKAMLQITTTQNPLISRVQYKIAHLSYQTNKVDQSLAYYEMLLQKEPQNHEALFNTADIVFQKRKFIKAKQLLESLLTTYPKDSKAKLLLAKVLSKLNQFNIAEHYLHSIIENSDMDEIELRLEAQEILAENYFENKNFVQSAEIYDALLLEKYIMQIPEKALTVMKNLIMCLIMKNEIKAAQYTYENNAEKFTAADKLEILYTMAEGLLKIGEFYRSINMIQNIYKKSPEFKDVKVTVNRYKDLLSAPNLKFIFTRDYKKAQQYIIQCLQLPSDAEVVIGNNNIILFDKAVNHIVNLSPFPIYTHEAQQIKNQLQMHDAIRNPIEFYSYAPMNQEMREVFKNLDYREIFGKAFIDEFKG